jgi:hypothetical protein
LCPLSPFHFIDRLRLDAVLLEKQVECGTHRVRLAPVPAEVNELLDGGILKVSELHAYDFHGFPRSGFVDRDDLIINKVLRIFQATRAVFRNGPRFDRVRRDRSGRRNIEN